jgi:hypothetical protein
MKYWFLFAAIFLSLQTGVLYAQEKTGTDFANNAQGLQEMMRYISGLERKARYKFTTTLKPTEHDFYTVFPDPAFAEKEMQYHKKILRANFITIEPFTNRQTDWIVWKTSAAELKNYENQAMFFPGGYREMAHQLNPNLTYFRIKFVEPGRQIGSGYDLFVYLGTRWVFIPRPWAIDLEK